MVLTLYNEIEFYIMIYYVILDIFPISTYLTKFIISINYNLLLELTEPVLQAA